ncbi:TIR domain-containing protein, partial [Tenacibaculum sp. UWU-22]|uniref:TIR domain-containing protein n=1 Tax=Tenacibaculum sp. UWU-22 TaxID=3234187 RepID=UPI0034DAD83C
VSNKQNQPMAKKKIPIEKQEVVLTKPKDVFEKELNDRIEIGKEMIGREIKRIEELETLENDYVNWNDFNIELLKWAFSDSENQYGYKYSKLNGAVGFMDALRNVDTSHPAYKLKMAKEKLQNSVSYLERLVNKLPLLPTSDRIEKFQTTTRDFTNVGFIVHGHNDALKLEVARFLENDLKKGAIILHEQASQGRTVIEKFENYSDVDFAIALWTNDDLGKVKDGTDLLPRARQNVIFETGFFIGKIGRKNVIILHESGIEIPSDYSGVVYVAIEGNWKDTLRKEINAIYN